MSVALEFKKVDILFPPAQGKKEALIAQAFELLAAGASRQEIQEKIKVVVGVTDASLAVKSGDISVLMGLSGSGKSTLLRAANRLNSVTRGEVLIKHRDQSVDVAHCDDRTLREIRRHTVAMMFQQFGLLPWRTVRDNVGLGLELRQESKTHRRQVVDEKLELVGLSAWADRMVSELSGGMQQRVGLARAFATDADILLMDEPFSALDPLIRDKLQDELLSLQQRLRKTILFVTHDLDEALKLGNQISILESGKIIQTGTPEDIVLHPRTDYVAEFVQHMNPLGVLTGQMVMTSVDFSLFTSGQGLALDEHLILSGSAHTPIVTGPTGRLHVQQQWTNELNTILVRNAKTTLKDLLKDINQAQKPVLLEADGKIVGFCGVHECVRALAQSTSRRLPAEVGAL